jgi:hypothetical protein
MTPIWSVVVCSIAALSLTASVWLADSFVAPQLFNWLWSWPRSWVAPAVFALIVPVLVALLAGYSFGLFPWRRTLPPALAVASVAAALEVLALFATSGLGGPRAWVFWLEAGALLVAFCVPAGVAARTVVSWSLVRRSRAGATGFATTVLAVGDLAYMGFRAMVA